MLAYYIVFNTNEKYLNPISLSNNLQLTNQFNQSRYDTVLTINDLHYFKKQLIESTLYGKVHPDDMKPSITDFYFGYYQIKNEQVISHSFITTNLDQQPIKLAQKYSLEQLLNNNLKTTDEKNIQSQLASPFKNQSLIFNDLLHQYNGGIGQISPDIYQDLLMQIEQLITLRNKS